MIVMAYCAYITTIKEILPHNNADRLKITHCFGNQCIIDLSYQVGDRVVYFPEGGQLDLDFCKNNNLIRIKNEDGTYSGGYMDENKRRITSVRLRGEASDGLVLPISCLSPYVDINELKDGDKIDVLNGVELCKKYIPKTNPRNNKNVSNGAKNVKNRVKKTSYPIFAEHADTNQLAYNLHNLHEGDLLTISLKMHGCFRSDAKVALWGQKKAKKIQSIKQGDYVIGYKDGKFVPSKVLNVFRNGKTTNWRLLQFERKGFNGDKRARIICTPEHLFFDFNNREYKPAKDLIVGEEVGLVKDSLILSKTSKEILLGMYLGDSYYNKDHCPITAVFQTSYKEEHFDYLLYIQKCLGEELFYIDNHLYTSGYGTKMRRGKTYACADLKNFFDGILDTCENSENKLTEKIVDYFSWISAAFLYMDDGSLCHNDFQKDRCNLAICDYNDYDANIIIKCFNKLGCYPVLYKDSRGYNRLRFNRDDAVKLCANIAPYICNCMEYKLIDECINCKKEDIYTKNEQGYVVVKDKIIKNEEYIPAKAITKYDLQTETVNYVVGNTLVHNSSGRYSNTIKETIKEPNKFLKLLGIKPKIKTEWEVIGGTRRCVLENYDGGYYGNDKFREKYLNLLKDKLPKGMTVYGEIVGWVNDVTPIMGSCSNKALGKDFIKKYGETTIFDYGCEVGESDFYVYRITMTNEDGYTIELNTEQAQIEAEKLGLKFVPVFETFRYTTEEDLMERVEKYYDGKDPIGNHIREGVVIKKENKDKFIAYKHKNFSFKVLSGIISENAVTEGLSDDMIDEMA